MPALKLIYLTKLNEMEKLSHESVGLTTLNKT